MSTRLGESLLLTLSTYNFNFVNESLVAPLAIPRGAAGKRPCPLGVAAHTNTVGFVTTRQDIKSKYFDL